MKLIALTSLLCAAIGAPAAAQSNIDGTFVLSHLTYDGGFDGDVTQLDLSLVYPLGSVTAQVDFALADESISSETSNNFALHLIFPFGGSQFGVFAGQAKISGVDNTYYGIEGRYEFSPVSMQWFIAETDATTTEEYAALDLTYRPGGVQLLGGDVFFTAHLSEFNFDIWEWDRKSIGIGWDSPVGATVELSAGRSIGDTDTIGINIGYQFGSGAIFERRDTLGVFTK